MLRIEKKLKEYDSNLFGRYSSCKSEVELLLQKYSANFPKYTDHSINHTIAVLRIVSDLLNDHEIEKMNGKELYVLCMGTILHDIGMCIPEEKIVELETNKRYTEYKAKNPGKEKEDLIRDLHHELSYDFIMAEYSALNIPNLFYAEAIALTAQAHRKVDLLEFETYNPQFSVESGREHVCLPYLGAVLRLADELDIENSRIPDLLYKYYLPENEKSRIEWEKHRATFLVTMHVDTIKIQAKTNDQNIYHALEVQFNKVESVLEECQKIIKRIAYSGGGEHVLQISKIKTDIKSEFVQKNIKFSINVPNVIETLMGKNLYNSELDAIRELIQNSLDSVLYKKSFGGTYIPSIIIDIYPDKLVCEDNGGGMDEYIIEKYFSKLSSSYYQSEKLSNNYNPIGKFGIGVFSYFMIAEFIEVKSKKKEAKALHFIVDKNPENYFYFYHNPQHDTEGTIITLNFNESFKGKTYVEIINYIKNTFKYIKVPIIIKVNGHEVEAYNNNTTLFKLTDFLDNYIDNYFWPLFLKQEIFEHKFDSENTEGALLLLPNFTDSSIISKTYLKYELSEGKTKPIKLYNRGIFVSEVSPFFDTQIFGVINIKKSYTISLNRSEIKGYEVPLLHEEISLIEKYISKLKETKKYKAANTYIEKLVSRAGITYEWLNKSDEFKDVCFTFIRKHVFFAVLHQKNWSFYKLSYLEEQNQFFVFQDKQMCQAHFPNGENLSILCNNVTFGKMLFSNHKIGLVKVGEVYLEVLYRKTDNRICEVEVKGSFSFCKFASKECIAYSNLYRDKDGDLIYTNIFVNSEYPLIKFLNSVIGGKYDDSQKAFALKRKDEFINSLNQFGGKLLHIKNDKTYYSQSFKVTSKIVDEINSFFKTKYNFKKNHLPVHAEEFAAKPIPLSKWAFL